eukprot:3816766-Pyramimonas_sp.AAC.1
MFPLSEGKVQLVSVAEEAIFPEMLKLLDRYPREAKNWFDDLDDCGNQWLPPALLTRLMKLMLSRHSKDKVKLDADSLRWAPLRR